MNIIVSGASGFVGTYLCRVLLGKGYYVTGIGTSANHNIKSSNRLQGINNCFQDSSNLFEDSDRFEWISADTTLEGPWQDKVIKSDVVINLTGKNILGYWTEKYKSQIYRSRVLTTENIVSALPDANHPSYRDTGNPSISSINSVISEEIRKPLILNTSAIGYYGDRKEDILTESEPAGNDFLATVCVDWENAALEAEKKGARVVLMRFGVVLGKNGGALGKMLPTFRFFAGGPLGKGLHWFPWIHIDDLVNAIIFFIENEYISGPVNLVAPGTLRHREFASALGHALNRPSFMPAPAFMIKAIMGEMGQAFLSSQRAIPAVLNLSGFSFQYGDIQKALEEILR